MNLGSKDIVTGGAIATSLVANLVFTHYKCSQLQKQIDELRKETRTLAQYVSLLESRITANHKVEAAHPQTPQHPAHQTPTPHQPATPVQNPHPPTPHIPQYIPPQQAKPVQQPVQQVQQQEEPAPFRRQPAAQQPQVVRKPVQQPQARIPQPQQQEEPEAKNSNRRAQAAPARGRYQPPVQGEGSSEESADDKDQIDSPPRQTRPAPPQAVVSERPKTPTRKFKPATSDDDTPKVSARRPVGGPRSILKQPPAELPPKEKEEEGEDPADDILGEIEQMAKSGEANGTKEGREESKSAVKARMDRTKQIAAQMQKNREARQ